MHFVISTGLLHHKHTAYRNILSGNTTLMITRFVFYGLTGWCVDVFWTGLGSLLRGDFTLTSRTYLWMFPIYGLAIFLEPVHNSIQHWPLLVRGSIYTVLIFLTEYITGYLLQHFTGACPWDYSGTPFSINGLIRLDYTPAWFVAGLLFERLHTLIVRISAIIG